MMVSKIEWLARPGTIPESWNPVTGCTKVSEGCKNCYAERMARRLAGRHGYPEIPNHFDVTLHLDRLEYPLKWKKPRTIFVCSMSDLFHEKIPHDFRTRIFDIMADERCEQHTFLLLTKRPQNIADWLWWTGECWPGDSPWNIVTEVLGRWPDNIWCGVTAENQMAADRRIPILLQIPTVVRFVSCEPLLGEVDLSRCAWPWIDGYPMDWGSIDWAIVGGESGLNARPMHPQWARDIRDQCRVADVPFFFKQWGRWVDYHNAPVDTKMELNRGKWHDDYVGECGHIVYNVGKKRAGHLLDGKEYHKWPSP